eukprot:6582107-Alexandrium_andersonii.AAC.1
MDTPPDTARTPAGSRTQPDTTRTQHPLGCVFARVPPRTGCEEPGHNEPRGHNEHRTQRTTGHCEHGTL